MTSEFSDSTKKESVVCKVPISFSTLFFFAVLSYNIKWGFVRLWTPPSSMRASENVASCTYTMSCRNRGVSYRTGNESM